MYVSKESNILYITNRLPANSKNVFLHLDKTMSLRVLNVQKSTVVSNKRYILNHDQFKGGIKINTIPRKSFTKCRLLFN